MFVQRTLAAIALGIVALLPVSARAASGASQEATFWRAVAGQDVEAAYQLIIDNHPAAVAALGDTAFTTALEAAHRQAAQRAVSVVDYAGYSATLAGFADALGDKHIWSRPTYVLDRPAWAGVLTSKRGNRWIVTDQVEDAPTALKGAELVGCDGMPAEAMAKRSLGQFRVDWSIGAQQIQASPWLLVDDHNPFVPRPRSCIFSLAGRKQTVDLRWSLIHREDLLERIKRASGSAAAGFGIRKVGAGFWISLGSLLDAAAPVVQNVERRSGEFRSAPFVVLDVRGNGGGSSIYGSRIAEAILGKAYVKAMLGDDAAQECDDVWRASPDNIAQLQSYLTELGPTRGAEFVRIVKRLLANAKAARAADRPWIIPDHCTSRTTPSRSAIAAPSPFKGKLLLLTDNRCFSSCLALTHDFRQLGAIQIGQTTDANTHYSEVREILLPSGLSYFSTLQAFAPGTPRQLGPFVPTYAFDGDIADTPLVEKWALGIATDEKR